MNYAKLYNKLYRYGYHKKVSKTHAKELISYMHNNLEFHSILDVGCSNGKAVSILHKLGKEATGIDVARIGIEVAKKMGSNCKYGSIMDIPFEDKSFDAVISTDVLEHIEESDVDTAVDEIVRVARKYIGIKVSPDLGQGKNNPKTRKNHPYFKSRVSIPNLHLTIRPRSWWNEQFIQRGLSLLWTDDVRAVFSFEEQ